MSTRRALTIPVVGAVRTGLARKSGSCEERETGEAVKTAVYNKVVESTSEENKIRDGSDKKEERPKRERSRHQIGMVSGLFDCDQS